MMRKAITQFEKNHKIRPLIPQCSTTAVVGFWNKESRIILSEMGRWYEMLRTHELTDNIGRRATYIRCNSRMKLPPLGGLLRLNGLSVERLLVRETLAIDNNPLKYHVVVQWGMKKVFSMNPNKPNVAFDGRYSVPKAAAALGIGIRTLYRWVQDGVFKKSEIGKRRYGHKGIVISGSGIIRIWNAID